MDFNDFKNIVKNTRCVRRFKPCEIKKDDLIQLIDLARNVSSAKNMQVLKYIPIVDEKIKDEVYKPLIWASHLNNWNQNENEKPSAYILIVNDTSIDGFAQIDSGIAMQTIMLGANLKGYGACMLASIDKTAYKKLFNLDSHLEPMFIIAFGKKDEQIKLVEQKGDESNYYRDEKGTHYVPKKRLEDIIIG